MALGFADQQVVGSNPVTGEVFRCGFSLPVTEAELPQDTSVYLFYLFRLYSVKVQIRFRLG